MTRALRDRFAPEHARARELAAARVGEPLDPDEAGWLDTHLAWCAPCRAVAGEYENQRLELRALRLDAPVPPRDLWARTAAALEVERTRKGIRTERATPRTTPAIRGRSSFPVGAFTGALAAVFVIGVTILGGRDSPGIPSPDTSQATTSAQPFGTPFPVPPRAVNVLLTDGTSISMSNTSIDRVCPMDVGPKCASLRLGTKFRVNVDLADVVREAVISPTDSHLVIVQRGSGGGASNEVVVVPVMPRASQSASTPTPPPSAEPAGSPDPGASPTGSGSPDPTDAPTTTPSEEPSPSTSADPSPSDTPPSDPPASAEPSDAPPSIEVTAPPDEDGAIVIAADVIVVGRSAAYSPDGTAFAFTARPTDGSHGPDIYLWRVGTNDAQPITSDHISVFSGWIGDRILLSRSDPDGDPQVAAGGEVPVSLLLDPETGEEVEVSSEPMFRPTVDPTRRAAVWWDGAIELGDDGFGWQPHSGRLLLGSWAEPDTEAPEPTGPQHDEDVLASGQVLDWDARWDETGTRLAVWIADRGDPSTGTLSLYGIDPTTGRIDPSQELLTDARALPGFSIGSGRLVWAIETEDGQTRVEVLAWAGDDVGHVELAPATEPLIIVR